jgi:hypothetical protein
MSTTVSHVDVPKTGLTCTSRASGVNFGGSWNKIAGIRTGSFGDSWPVRVAKDNHSQLSFSWLPPVPTDTYTNTTIFSTTASAIMALPIQKLHREVGHLVERETHADECAEERVPTQTQNR